MSKPSLRYQFRTCEALKSVPYSGSRDQYMRDIVKFADFCRETYGCRKISECREHVQDYADHLQNRGLSPSTIHTYLAPVCRVYDIPMSEIKKPQRITAENTRSRGTPSVDSRGDAKDSASPRLAAFADKVGIRREEYRKLRGRNWKQDENGYWCVEVEKGKGGKYHLQRIAPEDVAFVESYFDKVGPDDFVFSMDEMKNKIDLHAKRGENARRQYSYYVELFRTEEGARERIYHEIADRWEKYNKKRPVPSFAKMSIPYDLRKANREKAEKAGLPTRYDRLAVMAVSVFHLSHWREDVTVSNYLLA